MYIIAKIIKIRPIRSHAHTHTYTVTKLQYFWMVANSLAFQIQIKINRRCKNCRRYSESSGYSWFWTQNFSNFAHSLRYRDKSQPITCHEVKFAAVALNRSLSTDHRCSLCFTMYRSCRLSNEVHLCVWVSRYPYRTVLSVLVCSATL